MLGNWSLRICALLQGHTPVQMRRSAKQTLQVHGVLNCVQTSCPQRRRTKKEPGPQAKVPTRRKESRIINSDTSNTIWRKESLIIHGRETQRFCWRNEKGEGANIYWQFFDYKQQKSIICTARKNYWKYRGKKNYRRTRFRKKQDPGQFLEIQGGSPDSLKIPGQQEEL